MDSGLKQRLVGAVVLVALAVIFLPMLLDGSGARERLNEDIAIPEQPEAPESRLNRDGFESERGGAAAGNGVDATLATDEFGNGEAAGAADDTGQTVAEPGERSRTPDSTDAPVAEEEPASDEGAASRDTTGNGSAEKTLAEGWIVQVGSFRRETNALVLRDRLRENGFDASSEQVEVDGDTLWRVLLGPVAEREAGEALLRRIEDHRGKDALLMEYSQ